MSSPDAPALAAHASAEAPGEGSRRSRPGALARVVPSLLELLCVAAAILVLLPSFDRVAAIGDGRDQRFLERGLSVFDLPEPALAEICGAYGAFAEASVRDALCGARAGGSTTVMPSALPPVLASKWERATRAFVRPLRDADIRIASLQRQAEEGDHELRGSGDEVAAIEAEIAPFLERYRLTRSGAAGPAPLACAWRWGQAVFATRAAEVASGSSAEAFASARANAMLLLASALDGRAATAAIGADARLPAVPAMPASLATICPGIIATLGASAAVMADARQALVNERKNDAIRVLARSAGAQWSAAMLLGYGFVVWSRRVRRPTLGVATALVAWAAVAWLARVPWPFASARGYAPARADLSFVSAPATFVLCLGAAGVLLGLVALARGAGQAAPSSAAAPAQSMSSRVGYAGFVLATGVGALLLLDLSFNAHAGNRYLALYHQGHLWLAMLTLSLVVFLRRAVSRSLAWMLIIGGEAVGNAARRVGHGVATLVIVAVTTSALIAFAVALANMRQLTSEVGRVWLIFGAAWFFFLRAGPLTERLARSGPAGLSLLRYAWPMAFVVAVLVGAMFATRDMGPLLISGYASGAFVAAAVAMWWHHRSGQTLSAFVLAALLFALWIGAVTAALFHFGSLDVVAASRLESVAAPFASVNDQLALVSWFQRAAPADGFGLGTTPWCGYAPAHACSGVPAQIHSDYTLTAIIGVFGPTASWAMTLGTALWLHRLIRHHGRVTRGEPRLQGSQGRLANDGQALLSWVCVAWVALTSCQLAVTVAGNLAVLPLTGVTFPFVSFGMTSLLVNATFLALSLNVDLPPPVRHG